MIALAFSGGKDSLACWYLTKHLNPTVLWVSTGKEYPETLELVNSIPGVVKIYSDQAAQNRLEGLPSDLVPINWTSEGMDISGTKSQKVQSYMNCCATNIAKPLLTKALELGVTKLIRGERFEEDIKSSSRPGGSFGQIQFAFPIWDWDKEQVLSYLKSQMGTLPSHFSIEHSSLDCYDCTAFVDHSKDRVEFTRITHPLFYRAYQRRLGSLRDALKHSVNSYFEV